MTGWTLDAWMAQSRLTIAGAVALGAGAACGFVEGPVLLGAGADAGATDAADGGSPSGPGDATSNPEADSSREVDAGTDSSADAGAGQWPWEANAPQNACPLCPPSPPEAGTPCNAYGLNAEFDCEYGSDPRLVNVFARCLFGGFWYYGASPAAYPLADSGVPGVSGCPSTFSAAQVASSCDTPTCAYPEGTCTCYVAPAANAGDGGAFFSCLTPPLPAGCPASLDAAQSSTTCPANALTCYYPGGTCICFASDAGSPWNCTVPASGCPAVRPRIGSPCDLTGTRECNYIPIPCTFPTGHLLCASAGADAGCGGLWVSQSGALCQ